MIWPKEENLGAPESIFVQVEAKTSPVTMLKKSTKVFIRIAKQLL